MNKKEALIFLGVSDISQINLVVNKRIDLLKNLLLKGKSNVIKTEKEILKIKEALKIALKS
jgi:hypothetical protein